MVDCYIGQQASPLAQWSEARLVSLEARIKALENDRIQPSSLTVRMQELAAQQQATEHLYAPLRGDTRAVVDLAAFARRLIDMQDLGHAVTEEVRVLAKRALGI